MSDSPSAKLETNKYDAFREQRFAELLKQIQQLRTDARREGVLDGSRYHLVQRSLYHRFARDVIHKRLSLRRECGKSDPTLLTIEALRDLEQSMSDEAQQALQQFLVKYLPNTSVGVQGDLDLAIFRQREIEMLRLEQQIAQRGSNQGKKPIRYFVSYAHADKPDLNRFLEVFNPQLDTSASFQFSPWTDSNILPGERWREQIDQALKQCAFGLLLVSPNFLASNFIGREELPVLLAKQIVVPIALHPILFDGSMDLKGLESRQVFRDTKGRAFDQCGRMHTRRAFALELFSKLDTLFTKSPFTLG